MINKRLLNETELLCKLNGIMRDGDYDKSIKTLLDILVETSKEVACFPSSKQAEEALGALGAKQYNSIINNKFVYSLAISDFFGEPMDFLFDVYPFGGGQTIRVLGVAGKDFDSYVSRPLLKLEFVGLCDLHGVNGKHFFIPS